MAMDVLGGFLIVQIGGTAAAAYVPLQIYAIRKWQGGWRLAAGGVRTAPIDAGRLRDHRDRLREREQLVADLPDSSVAGRDRLLARPVGHSPAGAST